MGRDHRGRRPLQLGFLEDVLQGLARPQKALPPKYFYDATGSRLFERICRLREYYPTRVELAITKKRIAEIARFAGKGCVLIEYGSGESLKTRLLLEHLRPAAYVPVDISVDALAAAVKRLARAFPWLRVQPLAADFSRPLSLPRTHGRRVVYFPGSTIGNLDPDEAQAFLRMTRAQVGPAGAMLVGVDLKKDARVLHAAYNDAKGVTAAFNLNLLLRINRELGGDFQPRRFAHYAFYNPLASRIEMHLVAREAHAVRVGKYYFPFERGESIHTENSYKYSVKEFSLLARTAGWRPFRVWTDARGLFSVNALG